ncbi:hypothetical protein GCM10007857_25430 [Bradyrhizobium iriomotense]|uniref:Uncharacterized protein n=1 Tax=Bradyrhizobium iriomotense TaxID=441950 RepID=A0ABQ6B151_9BRAD|nr:hypothetical protein GCM10007857_25430 [Bradyrhizobium iriomotense]
MEVAVHAAEMTNQRVLLGDDLRNEATDASRSRIHRQRLERARVDAKSDELSPPARNAVDAGR